MCSVGNPFKKIVDHIFIDWREVAIALVKHKGIHEGLWRAGVELDMHAMMANLAQRSGHAHKRPAALISIERIDLMQIPEKEADELTIDAAEVNPRQRLIYPGAPTVN